MSTVNDYYGSDFRLDMNFISVPYPHPIRGQEGQVKPHH